MTKKILAILLAMLMILSVVACRGGSETDPTSPPATDPGTTEPGASEPEVTEPGASEPVADDYKIAIYTGYSISRRRRISGCPENDSQVWCGQDRSRHIS